jgi:hypothetical protein
MNKVDVTVDSKDEVDLTSVKRKYDQFADNLAADMKTLGDKAGKNFNDGIASGVEKAAARVVKAQGDQQSAVERLRIAQQRLVEVQENQNAKSSQRMQAEYAFETALRAVQSATDDVASAERRLSEARANERKPVEQSKVDLDFSGSGERLKNFGVSELKVAGGAAGVAYAGALASGLSSMGAAGLFVAIAAAAQSSNQQVAASYRTMWDQVKANVQADSQVLAQDFIQTAESLGRTLNDIRPELVEGFIAAKPVIQDFDDGLDRMVKSTMPGLVIAAKSAGEASGGMADMMDSAGKSVTNFFTETEKGSAAGGDAMRSFGVIVERLGSFAGRILAEVANNSVSLFPRVESTVDAAAGAVENLAHVALPGLAAGAGLALSGMTLLLNLASGLISVLGPAVPTIMSVVTGMKLLDTVSFGQVTTQWNNLKTSVGEAEGFTGKAKAAMSGLATGGMLPLTVIGAAVGVVLGDVAAAEQRAAAATAAHQRQVSELSDALRKSQGALDDNVKAVAAKGLADMKISAYNDKALETAQKLGISLPLVTQAYMGNKDAMGQVLAQLDALQKAGTTYDETNSSRQEHMTDEARSAYWLSEALKKNGGAMDEARLINAALAEAEGKTLATTSKLAAEFGTLSDKASSSEQKVSALVKIMDTMAGRKPDVEEATKAWEDMIDSFNSKDMNFDEKKRGSDNYIKGLVSLSGQIDLTREDGRKLYDTVTAQEKAFEQTAVAMQASGASSDEIRNKLQGMRDQFISTATAMGFTSEQAVSMANKFGLVPGNVSVIVSSNLSPEIQKAIELGGTIRALPDGTFVVTANTGAAQNEVTKFIQTNDGRVITVHVNTVTSAQTNIVNGSFSRLKASGGPVSHAAEGGARTGPIVVNEQGQEGARLPTGDVVSLPVGSSVITHSDMQSMSRTGAPQVIVLKVVGSGDAFSELLAQVIREYVRVVGGGNVQDAYGWGQAA